MFKNLIRLLNRYLLVLIFALPLFAVDTKAQEIGIQMGSMRELFKEDVRKALARIKELGVTELERLWPWVADLKGCKTTFKAL